MGDSRKVLEDIVGAEGYETLAKAIFRRGTNNVADPLELYLPLMVVPRAILSWLAQNIAPMPVGSIKEIRFPGKKDILINIRKDATDVYRGEMTQGGRTIHTFEQQTLPSIGGHIMSVMEQYDHLKDEKPEPEKDDKKPKKEAEKPEPEAQTGLVQHIMSANGIQAPDHEEAKWAYAHSNVKELCGVIGKLVDALVAKNLDKTGPKETEVKVNLNVRDSETPAIPAEHKNPETQYSALSDAKLKQITDYKPTPKERPEGKEAANAEPTKKEELLEKPYVSDAQRRWAHTDKGTKALGGKAAVHHWDQATKGKKLPEHVSKEEGIPPKKHTFLDHFGPQVSRKRKMAEAHRLNHEAKHGRPDPKAAMNAAVRAIEQHSVKKPEKKAEGMGITHPAVHGEPTGPGSMVPTAPHKQAAGTVATLKSGSSLEQNNSNTIRQNLSPTNFLSDTKPEIKKEELDKAGGPQKPGGAAMPKGPTPPKPPMPAVPAGRQPAAAAQKQAQASARGMQSKPPTAPKAPPHAGPKMPSVPKPPTIKSEEYFSKLKLHKPKSVMKSENYSFKGYKIEHHAEKGKQYPQHNFTVMHNDDEVGRALFTHMPNNIEADVEIHPDHRRKGLASHIYDLAEKITGRKVAPSGMQTDDARKFWAARSKVKKSQKAFHVSRQEILQPCEHCGTPEFTMKGEDPVYTPCACFRITLSDRRFLSLEKKENGYSLRFAKNADPDTVKAFLLTLKARLLLSKRFGLDEE